jgi:hypothetical protein
VSDSSWRVDLAPAAARQLKKLPPDATARARGPILARARDPRPAGSVDLVPMRDAKDDDPACFVVDPAHDPQFADPEAPERAARLQTKITAAGRQIATFRKSGPTPARSSLSLAVSRGVGSFRRSVIPCPSATRASSARPRSASAGRIRVSTSRRQNDCPRRPRW